VVGNRGQWELTVLSVENRDSIAFLLGRVEPEAGETFLVVGFRLRSLGDAAVSTWRPDWFQVVDADARVFPAYTWSAGDDFGRIGSGRMQQVEFDEPAQELGRLLMFPLPESAAGLRLEFTGDLDEFPSIPLPP
jgi:hypothetical protein